MKYKVIFPFIPSMGSVSPIIASDSATETVKQNALWHLNRMREHDGLTPLRWLPKGTLLVPQEDTQDLQAEADAADPRATA